MKKNYLLPFLFLFLVILTSCSETSEVGKYDNWQERNEAFIDSLKQVVENKTDLDLIQITPYGEKRYPIYAKKLKAVKTPSPSSLDSIVTYTDSVNVFYRGMLIDESVFAAVPSPRYYTKLYQSLIVFDKNFSGDDPTSFDSPTGFWVNRVVAGWSEVLQRMTLGERWEVYVPWQQGYGSAGTANILGYSTLIFDIQLEKIIKKK
ncbi:FKBP-type peptidyl-prolyl cis-trans isomerase [uncultured Bacteroides sp.]|uniref:FKBP-type peptidyl-prolyl cis-trans isomerase n=1 Tax=uncultured Bacteroides sp. TaxID=162156 RepID=UPI002AAB1789|nr:FKBP-type peptidyl-prolyl cis-trans isomerase [uncultured Bacteroides sp.]